MISLASIVGNTFRLVISSGEILETQELLHVPMPYFHVRPATGMRKCMGGWLQNGGAHHQVHFLGDHFLNRATLSRLRCIECVIV